MLYFPPDECGEEGKKGTVELRFPKKIYCTVSFRTG